MDVDAVLASSAGSSGTLPPPQAGHRFSLWVTDRPGDCPASRSAPDARDADRPFPMVPLLALGGLHKPPYLAAAIA